MRNKIIFNSSLLVLVLSMSAFDGPGHIQYISAAISSAIILLYAYANRWTV